MLKNSNSLGLRKNLTLITVVQHPEYIGAEFAVIQNGHDQQRGEHKSHG